MRTRRILAMAVLLAACSNADSPGHGAATVTVDLFSGLPNPSWEIDAATASRIVAAWEALPATTPIEYPGTLGYRGVTAEFADGWRLVITRGVATVSGVARADHRHALERMLVETGRGRLDPETLALVLAAIDG